MQAEKIICNFIIEHPETFLKINRLIKHSDLN